MNKIIYTLVIIGLISCDQQKQNNNQSKPDISISETNPSIIEEEINEEDKSNELRSIEPDFFNLSDAVFNQFKNNRANWFISSNHKSKLYFVPYTDYSITTAILTEEDIEDPDLIHLLQSEGIQFGNLKETIEIKQIISEKGVKLGLSIKDVEAIFGLPDFLSKTGRKDLLKWSFTMLETPSDKKIGGLRPFIVEGLEFIVEMEFVQNRLTEVIYRYEVP